MNLASKLSDEMKRYEKKYSYLPPIDQRIEFSILEQGFVLSYKPRLITSIYYDTPDFSLYTDSVRGYGIRSKLRARFYDLKNQCTFEKKVRAYDTGYKHRQDQIRISPIVQPLYYSDPVFNSSAELKIPASLDLIYIPRLVISYSRRYFIHSVKQDLRITLDAFIRHGRVAAGPLNDGSLFADISAIAGRNVLEIKYSSKDESFSSVGVSSFADINLINERHSKYCNAVNALF